ncbi:MAG: molybdopterin-dependent oxidoreductase, partial [Actinomycetes bacterium]
MSNRYRHTSHWGAFTAEVEDDHIVGIHPHEADPDPSPLLGNFALASRHRSRVGQPAIRRGWLEDGPGSDERRGCDEWVAVGWDEALDLVATELRRVRDGAGPEAIYAGSYGWASAGRFHHSQSQLRRFVNHIGGATVSVGTYSTGAAERILPRVVGSDEDVWRRATAWPVVAAHTELLVCFGGLPSKNAAVSPGGVTRHAVGAHLAAGRRRGMEVVVFSPIADDVDPSLAPTWHALRPGTDVAVMAALAFVLVESGRADLDFCARYCVGAEELVAYLAGDEDGVAKTPEWAEAISEVPAATIRGLARQLAERRSLITTSWSLQRSQHGEQPVWMSIALAALVGQIGLPGGGFGHGYSSLADIGGGTTRVPFPALPGGGRPLRSWIPVARVADMLLHPGAAYDFDGARRRYPQIELVYWVGGNPFHHHQDLNRLRRAL